MTDPLYPKVRVKLTGRDGNAFAIMGALKEALKKGGAPKSDIELYLNESMSGDYDNLLATACRWVHVS